MWTLLFDIDGTLIRTHGSGMLAIGRVMSELFGVSDLPSVTVHGCTDYGIICDLFRPFDIDVESNIEAFKEKYWEYLPHSLTQRTGEILPGVVDLLEALSARSDVAMGIITGNTRQSAAIKLKHFGLDKYFRFGGYGDDHADRNDVARQALIASQQALGDRLDVSRLWMIGDTVNDIRCGRAINSKVIAVKTGGGSMEQLEAARPDVLLDSLADNKKFFEKVFVFPDRKPTLPS